jgi:phage baseplate assembly protein W
MSSVVSRSFRDISLSFKKNPVSNDIIILKNEDAIKKSVINLVRTRVGERFFNNRLGTSIEDSMFEIADESITIFLSEEITTLLNNYEPRIRLNIVTVEIPDDSNELIVQINYDIVGLPAPPQNIDFILQPTRI